MFSEAYLKSTPGVGAGSQEIGRLDPFGVEFNAFGSLPSHESARAKGAWWPKPCAILMIRWLEFASPHMYRAYDDSLKLVDEPMYHWFILNRHTNQIIDISSGQYSSHQKYCENCLIIKSRLDL